MKRIIQLCALIFLLSLKIVVHAEGNCPPGYYPTTPPGAPSQGCAPIPGYNDQQSSTQQSGPPQMASPSPPSEHWESRWGAIATDEPHGVFGAVTGMYDKQSAERAALADCKAKGGINCKLEVSYVNGCAALTVSSTGYNVGADATLDIITAKGMKTCVSAGASNCHIYYSACSPAVRVQ